MASALSADAGSKEYGAAIGAANASLILKHS